MDRPLSPGQQCARLAMERIVIDKGDQIALHAAQAIYFGHLHTRNALEDAVFILRDTPQGAILQRVMDNPPPIIIGHTAVSNKSVHSPLPSTDEAIESPADADGLPIAADLDEFKFGEPEKAPDQTPVPDPDSQEFILQDVPPAGSDELLADAPSATAEEILEQDGLAEILRNAR